MDITLIGSFKNNNALQLLDLNKRWVLTLSTPSKIQVSRNQVYSIVGTLCEDRLLTITSIEKRARVLPPITKKSMTSLCTCYATITNINYVNNVCYYNILTDSGEKFFINGLKNPHLSIGRRYYFALSLTSSQLAPLRLETVNQIYLKVE